MSTNWAQTREMGTPKIFKISSLIVYNFRVKMITLVNEGCLSAELIV